MGLIGGLGKGLSKGLGKGALGKLGKGALGQGALLGKAGELGKGVLGKAAQVGKAGLEAVGGPQGIMDIVSKSQEAGQQQAQDITGQVMAMLQNLQG